MKNESETVTEATSTTTTEPTSQTPSEIAAQFPGDPATVQLPFLRKIAAAINKDTQSTEEADAVAKWAAALKAIYG